MSIFLKKMRGALAFAAAFGVSSCVGVPAIAGIVAERDVAVLKAVLLSEQCRHAEGKYRIISDKPAVPAHVRVPEAWASSSMLNAGLSRRSKEMVTWPRVDVCGGARMVDGSTIEAIFAQDNRIPPGWESFFDVYPAAVGVAGVSLPAFTSDGKRAVVYLDTSCGVTCGAGFYIELTSTKAGWQVTRRETAWIS